jgi:hypothetical protein
MSDSGAMTRCQVRLAPSIAGLLQASRSSPRHWAYSQISWNAMKPAATVRVRRPMWRPRAEHDNEPRKIDDGGRDDEPDGKRHGVASAVRVEAGCHWTDHRARSRWASAESGRGMRSPESQSGIWSRR